MKIRRILKYSSVTIVIVVICSISTFILGVNLGASDLRVHYAELANKSQIATLQNPSTKQPEMQLPKTFQELILPNGSGWRSDSVMMGEADIAFERIIGSKSDHVFSVSGMSIDRETFLMKYLAQLIAADEDPKHSMRGMSGEEGWELYYDGEISVFVIQYHQHAGSPLENDVVEVHILGSSGLWRRAILGWEG